MTFGVNPLVVAATDGGPGSWSGIYLAEDIELLHQGVKSGSWVDVTLGGVGASMDAFRLATDPLGTLAAWGVAWLLDHVRPLREALDRLAGDPAQISANADTWRNAAKELTLAADDYHAAADRQVASWRGQAGDAYRATAGAHEANTRALAQAAATMGSIVEGSGMLVALVRTLVRDAIAEFVSVLAVRLWEWAAEAAGTLGLGTPWVIAQVASLVGKWAERISQFFRALLNSLRRLGEILAKLANLIENLLSKLGKRASAGLDRLFGRHPGAGGHALSDAERDAGRVRRPGHDGEPSPSGKGQRSEGNGKTETGTTDPVDVVSGQVLDAQDDVVLPGLLPLVLRRAYASDYQGGGLLGPGWSSTLDQRVVIDTDGISFAGDDAQVLHYPIPGRGAAWVYPTDGARWPLAWDRTNDVITIVDPRSGEVRQFSGTGADRVPGREVRPLSALTDRAGREIRYLRDEAGVPVEIRHHGGYRLAVDACASGGGTRIGTVRLLDGGADGAGTVLLRYGYDDSGRLVEVVDSSDVPYRYEYDGAHRMVAWTDRAGARYSYTYDTAGRAVRGTGPDGFLSCAMRYDTVRRVTIVTDSLGNTTEYHYDENNHVLRTVDPLGNTTITERDAYGQLLSRTDPLGSTTTHEYDSDGNVTRTVLADGTVTTAEYNHHGQPILVVGPDRGVWHYGYDERGNVTSATDPTGATTRYRYDTRGMLAGFTDALGNTATVEADPRGLVVQVGDPRGGTLRYLRDAFGRIAEAVDGSGITTRYGWTVEGLPAWREAPDGTREEWTYNAAGNAMTYRAPTGHVTSFTYTHFNLPATRTGRDNGRYTFSYDTDLRLTCVTNPQGLQWRYEYDAAGRLSAETDFNGRTVRYVSDATGYLAERINGAGQRVRYVRDRLGRVVRRHVGSEVTTLQYDGAGRLVHAVGPDARIDLAHDAAGRIVAESIDGHVVRSEFDTAGRRTARTVPSGLVSRWWYDPSGRPVELRTPAGSLRFGYDAAGRETSRFLGSVATVTQSWDPSGSLTGQAIWAHRGDSAAAGDFALIQQRAYRYRADGTPEQIDDRLRGSRRYLVDPAGRVTAVRAATWTERYAYDAAGNLIQDNDGDREYEGTVVRRAGPATYAHDDQGRVVSQTRRGGSGQEITWRYTWNAEDHLTGVTTPDGTRWRYRYDPLGRRVAKQRLADDGSVAEETRFAWDGTILAEETTRLHGSSATVTRTWDYEPGSYRPAAQTDSAGTADQDGIDRAFYAIVADLVGTPQELVGEDGEVAWQYGGDLWGRETRPPPAGTDCPLRFPGQYRDQETGWHYNYARYYDPSTAQYASPDPIGLDGGPNEHGYVDNPLSWLDPVGLAGYKSDAQMLADANAIHDAFRTGKTGVNADKTFQGTAVATGEFDGRYVYTVNQNYTSKEVRQTAQDLGYERIHGSRYLKPEQDHAEQIMLNAHDKGDLTLSEGNKGRIAPSRTACGPLRQDCRGRIAGYPNITLIE